MVENKVIVVTGAGGGMGEAIVKTLLKNGAVVIGLDITDDKMKLVDNERFSYETINLLNEQDVKDVFAKVYEKNDKIDGLVNAAGIAQHSASIEDVTLDEWNKINGINSTALFLTCREATRYMKKKNSGSIVNIVSVAACRPRPGLQAYVASKGAAEMFTKALALEVAPFGIRSNVLHPGPAETTMLGKFSKIGEDVDATKEEVFRQSVPLGSLIEPQDIAEGVLYFMSDASKIVTGASLNIDGGRGI